MFKGLKPILYGGREVWPLIEGGKGVSATNHASSGAWAAAGGIGTVSAVNADSYDPEGRIIPQVYHALTRRERHEELIQLRDRRRGRAGPARLRDRRRQGRDQHQRAVGDGRRAARPPRRARADQGPGRRRHLRRRHALQADRDRRVLRRQLSADHQLGARLPRACGSAPITRPPNGSPRWSTRIRGWPAATTACPTPRTRASRRIPIRGSRRCARRCATGGIADSVPIVMAGGVWHLRRMGATGSTIPSSARSPSSSAPGRC